MVVLVAASDMFFIAKIESVAKIVGAGIHFVKSIDELIAKAKIEAVTKIIIDLNFQELKPIEAIERIRTDQGFASVKLIGYLSHVEMGELGSAARNAGCDYVMPKSAFSENLPEILKA